MQGGPPNIWRILEHLPDICSDGCSNIHPASPPFERGDANGCLFLVPGIEHQSEARGNELAMPKTTANQSPADPEVNLRMAPLSDPDSVPWESCVKRALKTLLRNYLDQFPHRATEFLPDDES